MNSCDKAQIGEQLRKVHEKGEAVPCTGVRLRLILQNHCGVEQLAARKSHWLEVASSSLAPATTDNLKTNKKMKVLTLIIKQEFFDAILAGEKKTETREIRPKTASRYIEYYNPETGETYPDPEAITQDAPLDARCIQYDAIRFFVGYAKDRATALVEVTGAQYFILTNDQGEDIVYEYKGREYVAAQIDYSLGNIIESNV